MHDASRLMVTGAAGFIGANFVHHWLGRHPGTRVVAVDALTYAGNRDSLAAFEGREDFAFVAADVRDQAGMQELIEGEAIDTIVHFAAESHVDRSIKGPDAFIQTNVLGTYSLLEAARAAWLSGREAVPHRFHHVSTDEVYGELDWDDPAFAESHAYAPNSPYSASKAASDHLVRAYHATYGLQVTTSNCSNNYGPFQFPEKLVALMITHLLDGLELPVYGDGSNVRDWLYVGDHCRGIESILADGRSGETYNIGGDEERSNLELVTTLCRTLDALFSEDPDLAQRFPNALAACGRRSEESIRFVSDRPGHDRRYAIDASKIRAELGFSPRHSFTSGLRQTIRWYLANENWWRKVAAGEHQQWLQSHYGLQRGAA